MPPREIKVSKKKFNLVISLVKFQTINAYVAAKKVTLQNSRIVKQSSDLKTNSN